MHILSARRRDEFLATPQLVRFEYIGGSDGFEPTILLKGSTLLLKYLTQGAHLKLVLSRIGDRLLYGVKVLDDELRPGVLWSLVEDSDEIIALSALTNRESCVLFLFNELALNVAWTTVQVKTAHAIHDLIGGTILGPSNYDSLKGKISAALSEGRVIDLHVSEKWHPVHNHFITSFGSNSPVDLFSQDEGGQQEQLAIWLTDSLHPLGVHHSPQIPKGTGHRELTDVILSYEHGSILIESKTLTVFNRQSLPGRAKLASDVTQHVDKAVRQLRGGIRKLKDGVEVTSRSGDRLEIERSRPMHAIVLIPEFSLVEDPARYGRQFISEFMEATGGYIHLLDVAELLRVVQAAETISKSSKAITPLMALDYYLLQRAERTKDAGTLVVEVLLRKGTQK